MKITFAVLITTILSGAIYANELQWVDEQIEAIKPPRKGVNILKVDTPFVFLEKNRPEIKKEAKTQQQTNIDTSQEESSKVVDQNIENDNSGIQKDNFNLDAIINSSAMINGGWYKKNDIIDGYVVFSIDKTSVILKKDTKELILSTYINNSSLKFKSK